MTITPYTLDRLFFNNLWDTTVFTNSTNELGYSQHVTDEEYVIEMPMVGISKDKLTVDVEDNVLTVAGKAETKSNHVKNVKQSWTLRKDCDVDNVAATLENGLLTLKIPRIKPAKKSVKVQVN